MSNATDTPRKSGGQRRRRSRGGRNRNQQQDRNQGDSNPNRTGRSRSRSGSRVRRQPVKLTFWQKLLKAIGLYKAPSKPARKKGKPSQEPKSNTRNARTSDEAPKQRRDKKPARNSNKKRGGDPSTVASSRVYVGNLSYDVTEQDLKELFKGIGTVRSVEIVYNRNTHRSKGYGFVEMIHKDDAMRCVEVLHDQPFMGREMIVSGAKSKEEGDERDDQEPHNEIKAADVELAPLPEKQAEQDEAPANEPAEEVAGEESEATPSAQAPETATDETAADDAEEPKQG